MNAISISTPFWQRLLFSFVSLIILILANLYLFPPSESKEAKAFDEWAVKTGELLSQAEKSSKLKRFHMTLSDVDAKVIRSFEVNSERDKEKYIATIERLRNLKEYLVSLDKASKDQPSLKIVVTEASENFVFHFDKDERHSLKLKTLLVALLD